MDLREIYRPIAKELQDVENTLKENLHDSRYRPILKIGRYVLGGRGKRLRPALVLLSARASQNASSISRDSIVSIAACMELIHMASLVHDDIIDMADLRHNKPSVNSKWGQDVSVVLGDYLYSLAFELISNCANPDIIRCISFATKAMCEGELIQVCQRDNVKLLKERYILIVKKKTASLFAASCQAGALLSNTSRAAQTALRNYGLNFGIAFQVIDDYMDFSGGQKAIGKRPGQDLRMGEITLPVLNLLQALPREERRKLRELFKHRKTGKILKSIKDRMSACGAAAKTREYTMSLVNSAKHSVEPLTGSPYKESLMDLADFIVERGFPDE